MLDFFKKHKAEPAQKDEWEPPEPEFELGTRRIRRYWDDNFGEYRYRMEKYTVVRVGEYSCEGRWDIVHLIPYPIYGWEVVNDGKDKDWAGRQAKHYDLTLEEV